MQRWERNEALPVHRHRHDKRGTVYAFRHEINSWREDRSQGIVRGGRNGHAAAHAPDRATSKDAAGATAESPGASRAAAMMRKLFPPDRKALLATRLAALILFVVAVALAWFKIQGSAG